MEQEVYGKEVAEVILGCLVCREVPNAPDIPDEIEIQDDGVYIKKGYLASDPVEQAFTWTPACEMDWPGAPDPLTAPSLPIPFTASHLAAFMLDAVGYGIQGAFGRIDGDPDEAVLESLGIRATKVRKVLRDAYNLAKQAQSVAGADNYDEQQRAADLLLKYADARSKAVKRHKVVRTHIDWKRPGGEIRRIEVSGEHYLRRLDRVNKSVAAQKADAERAEAEADTKHKKWRKTMVHQLLPPGLPTVSSTTSASLSKALPGDRPELPKNTQAWCLIRPQRFQGYGKPLFDFLRAAFVAGEPLPKARDVLDSWKGKPPLDVTEVTDDGLKYLDAKGNTNPADLDAIRKAIGRMTEKTPN